MGSSSGARALDTASYTLTVSRDPRLLPTVYDLTAKTAEMLGCPARAAVAITNAVQLIVETIVGPRVEPSDAGLIDVRFEADPETLRVEIVSEPPKGHHAGWTVETALVERRQLDPLRALCPDVEFVTRGRRHSCRLICSLAPRA
jgi:hypothetical protein